MVDLETILVEAFRILFLAGMPLLIVVGLAGLLAGAMQTATSLQDVSVAYVARLAAVILVLYFTLAASLSNIKELLIAVLK